ncbi:MAG: hypothetical protein JWM33_3066 [Caulobacteraceae bacterium]|nr:hypothetical protein [Caulobacteraceae bacterium]
MRLLALLSCVLLPAMAMAADVADRLPSEVVGVVGSGDQLRLVVRSADGQRSLSVGETYADGWTATAIRADSVTLSHDGQMRIIGMSPDGRLPPPREIAAPSQVSILGRSPEDFLRQALAEGSWDGHPMDGLTQEQTETRVAIMMEVSLVFQDRRARGDGPEPPRLTSQETRALLGDARVAALLEILATPGDGPTPRLSFESNGFEGWHNVITSINAPER